MFRSIFSRLVCTYIAVLLLVALSMFGAMSSFYMYNTAEQQFDKSEKAAGSIEYLTILVSNDMADSRVRTLYNTSLSSWSDIIGADITVVDSIGDVYASTNNIKAVPSSMTERVLSGETFRCYTHISSYYHGLLLVIGFPITYDDSVIGGVFFNTPLTVLRHSLKNFFEMFLLSSLFSLLLAVILIYLQAKNISKPIVGINSAVLDIASGRFEKRLPITSYDEIGQLASSFNYMADSLQQLDRMRENFISDVSHELRTPMTSISGFVEGIIDGTIPPEKHIQYLNIVLEESRRLSRMASDMLEMSKMNSSEYKLDLKKFDLCELVRLAIISLDSKIDSKSLELDVNFSHDQINVLADKDSILRVIINLLDNAVKFSYENTKISISVWCDVHSAYFRVGNFGIGIDQKDLEHVFDRFYKTDKSRGNDKTGAGLGLSMAKNILKLHNNRIWAESTTAKEGSDVKFTAFTFTLELA